MYCVHSMMRRFPFMTEARIDRSSSKKKILHYVRAINNPAETGEPQVHRRAFEFESES